MHRALSNLMAIALVGACQAPRGRPICEPGAVCSDDDGCVLETELYGRVRAVSPNDLNDSGQSNGPCSAVDAGACRASSVTCAVWGQCSVLPKATESAFQASGTCVRKTPDVDRDFQGSREPACAGLGTCIAASDGDCRGARICALEGRCHAAQGICVATPEDCAKSQLCADLGWCTRGADSFCGAGSTADCARSAACRNQYECGVANGRCVACAASEGCKQSGLCERVDTDCRATSDDACKRAEVCKRQGLCKASHGACVH